MSWSFNFKATSKAEAVEKLRSEPQVSQHKYCPETVVGAIETLIAALPDDKAVSVESNGHHMGEAGLENVGIKVGIAH